MSTNRKMGDLIQKCRTDIKSLQYSSLLYTIDKIYLCIICSCDFHKLPLDTYVVPKGEEEYEYYLVKLKSYPDYTIKIFLQNKDGFYMYRGYYITDENNQMVMYYVNNLFSKNGINPNINIFSFEIFLSILDYYFDYEEYYWMKKDIVFVNKELLVFNKSKNEYEQLPFLKEE